VAYYHTTIKYDEDCQGDREILEMEASRDRDRFNRAKTNGAQRGSTRRFITVKVTKVQATFSKYYNRLIFLGTTFS